MIPLAANKARSTMRQRSRRPSIFDGPLPKQPEAFHKPIPGIDSQDVLKDITVLIEAPPISKGGVMELTHSSHHRFSYVGEKCIYEEQEPVTLQGRTYYRVKQTITTTYKHAEGPLKGREITVDRDVILDPKQSERIIQSGVLNKGKIEMKRRNENIQPPDGRVTLNFIDDELTF